jgi:hypothetical protein|tara:strand:- start:208 stop:588 length:381 start_codon:yes stop_codon:yes gene_type:complete
MADLKCKFCGEDLTQFLENGKKRHGNQKYHKHCYEKEKLKRQTENYSRGREIINQLIKNDCILEKFYKSISMNKLIQPIEISKEGFDYKLYTGEDKVNDFVIKRELNYGYQLVKKEAMIYIKIHKL